MSTNPDIRPLFCRRSLTLAGPNVRSGTLRSSAFRRREEVGHEGAVGLLYLSQNGVTRKAQDEPGAIAMATSLRRRKGIVNGGS